MRLSFFTIEGDVDNMYEQLVHLSLEQKVELLTKTLVKIESVNGTEGEEKLAEFVKELLQTFPYFIENPHHLWVQSVPQDPVNRKNIFAFVKGKKQSAKTIVYHAHLDTVGIDDYGHLKHIAYDADELKTYFMIQQKGAEVQADAASGDWLFGRGALDMKSGIAVHLVNTLYFTERIKELEGNVLLVINGDEESEHRGILAAVKELKRVKAEYQLDYVTAINNDFIAPLYEGDQTRYLYTGTAGKVLPCFYIHGRTVHVGDTLLGIDPNVIASELTRSIHNNMSLAEELEGEMILPPTCLYQRDGKDAYNVQTAVYTHLYFNYFMYEKKINEVTNELLKVARQACKEVEHRLAHAYEDFCRRAQLPNRTLSFEVEVVTLHQYLLDLQIQGIDPRSHIEQTLIKYESLEARMKAFKLVEALQALDASHKPRVILFYAPPYLPHNHVDVSTEKGHELVNVIHACVEKFTSETNEKFEVRKFFPYLSDGSFLSFSETQEEIQSFTRNFPGWEFDQTIPFQEIKDLDIPSINLGVYGKDGHKWTERVYKPYSFKILPQFIQHVTTELLKTK